MKRQRVPTKKELSPTEKVSVPTKIKWKGHGFHSSSDWSERILLPTFFIQYGNETVEYGKVFIQYGEKAFELPFSRHEFPFIFHDSSSENFTLGIPFFDSEK